MNWIFTAQFLKFLSECEHQCSTSILTESQFKACSGAWPFPSDPVCARTNHTNLYHCAHQWYIPALHALMIRTCTTAPVPLHPPMIHTCTTCTNDTNLYNSTYHCTHQWYASALRATNYIHSLAPIIRNVHVGTTCTFPGRERNPQLFTHHDFTLLMHWVFWKLRYGNTRATSTLLKDWHFLKTFSFTWQTNGKSNHQLCVVCVSVHVCLYVMCLTIWIYPKVSLLQSDMSALYGWGDVVKLKFRNCIRMLNK